MLNNLKITEAELAGNDISSLPDRPGDAGITTAELKARFDAIPKTLLALGKFNQVIDQLTSVETGNSGADSIGAAPIEGIEGGTVQAQLNSMSGKTAEAAQAAETAAAQGTAATQAAEAATQAAADAAAKAQAATAAAQTAAAQGEQAAAAAQLATTAVTEVKAYAEEQAQSAKDYVDQAILDAGAVTSVFGRAGAITAEAGDYTAEQVSMTGYDSAAAAITGAIELANAAGNAAEAAQNTADAAATAATYTATLTAAGWSDTAPYTQTVAVSGILATDSPIVDIVLSEGNETAELEAWGYIGRINTAANSITVTCFEDKPSIDLNIQIKVVR